MPLPENEVRMIDSFFGDNWENIVSFIMPFVYDSKTNTITNNLDTRSFIDHARDYAYKHGMPNNIVELLSKENINEGVIKFYYRRMVEEIRKKKAGVSAPPPPAAPPPGIPTDESNIDAAAKELNLSKGNAAQALRITKVPNSYLTTDDGTKLIHDTRDSASQDEGVPNLSGGGKKITFFYMKQGNQYFLVAWGVHIGKKKDGLKYRIIHAVKMWKQLENQKARFK